jgi:predicted peptidase
MAQSSEHLRRAISKTVEAKYLLHLPEGYEQSRQLWPLILHLHGAGERGADFEKLRAFGLARVVERQPEFPFIVVSPLCPEDDFWRNEILFALLDDVCERHAVDVQRVYVTGASMGGYGTWNLAAHEPQRFAAIAPICGRAAGLWTWPLTKMPIWVFHGERDPIVPLDESARMVEALKKQGNDVKFTIYPRGLHDVWTRTYRSPELFDWFLTFKRPLNV